MNRFWILLLLPLALTCLTAGAKKSEAMSVQFHCETTAQDGSTFATKMTVGNPPRQLHIEKMPTITDRDIKSIYPFPAQDGSGSMGAYFMVDNHGANLLQAATTQHRNSYMIPVINGRPVSLIYIASPVKDGVISVPSGITPEEVVLMAKTFSIYGETATDTKNRRAADKKKQQK